MELLRISGDSEVGADAFAEFYDRHYDALTGYLCRRVLEPEIAADLVAETFLTAHQERRKLRKSEGSARAWLIGIARNKLNHALRGGETQTRAIQRYSAQVPAVDERTHARMLELADLPSLRAALRSAISMVPEDTARAVWFRVVEELPYAEIGEKLNCSEGAARLRVLRGVRILRSEMEGADDG